MLGMNVEIKRLIYSYLIAMSLLTAASGAVFAYFEGTNMPVAFVSIPLFFILTLLAMLLIRRNNTKKGKPQHMFLLLYRAVRMFMLIAFVVVSCMLLQKENLLRFMIVFCVFYIVLGVVETVFLLKLSKSEK